MSTSAVSATSLNQQLHEYFHSRQSDLRQLGQALGSGDLAAAQAVYGKIVSLGHQGPFASGNPFHLSGREHDFQAIGTALQAGNLAGAQQAFNALKATFQQGGGQRLDPPPTPTSGPEIILNLSPLNGTTGSAGPEQIAINISNPASGGEQISLSIGGQGSSAQQVTFNLPSNSNEQIVLNLLNASPSSSGASTTSITGGSGASGGISISA